MSGAETLKINETNRKECWEKKREVEVEDFEYLVDASVVERILHMNQQVLTAGKRIEQMYNKKAFIQLSSIWTWK